LILLVAAAPVGAGVGPKNPNNWPVEWCKADDSGTPMWKSLYFNNLGICVRSFRTQSGF
jgi:hypothetical protein